MHQSTEVWYMKSVKIRTFSLVSCAPFREFYNMNLLGAGYRNIMLIARIYLCTATMDLRVYVPSLNGSTRSSHFSSSASVQPFRIPALHALGGVILTAFPFFISVSSRIQIKICLIASAVYCGIRVLWAY